jgi:hypothetical protein
VGNSSAGYIVVTDGVDVEGFDVDLRAQLFGDIAVSYNLDYEVCVHLSFSHGTGRGGRIDAHYVRSTLTVRVVT